MKLFSIFFYIGLAAFLVLLYGYFHLNGFENMMYAYKDLSLQYGFYDENIDFFTLNFHFYLIVFFAVFFTFWGGLMSGKIKMVYLPLVMAIVFAAIAYHMPVVQTGFYIASLVILVVFYSVFLSVPQIRNQIGFIKKISDKRKQEFKNDAIQCSATFVQVIFDYSFKINNRPSQRAVYKTTHPLTGEEFLAKTERFFDPLLASKAPQEIYVYFHRHDSKKYLVDFTQ